MCIQNMHKTKSHEFVQNIISNPYKEHIQAEYSVTYSTHTYHSTNKLYQISAHKNMHNSKQSLYIYSKYNLRVCSNHPPPPPSKNYILTFNSTAIL
jgi:hypothetical protein